jgi:hypothetical protein
MDRRWDVWERECGGSACRAVGEVCREAMKVGVDLVCIKPVDWCGRAQRAQRAATGGR